MKEYGYIYHNFVYKYTFLKICLYPYYKKQGMRDGKGKHTWPDGSYYEGDWL